MPPDDNKEKEQHQDKTESSIDNNKISLIFDNPEHKLGEFVQRFGSNRSAYERLLTETRFKVNSIGISGRFEVDVQIENFTVTVRGNVISGVAKIGTAFIK